MFVPREPVRKTDLVALGARAHMQCKENARSREESTMNNFKRRDFLKATAAFAATSAAGGFGCVEVASAQPIQVPTVDKLTMQVLMDQAHDQFLRGSTVK